jgi:hypothetical protein
VPQSFVHHVVATLKVQRERIRDQHVRFSQETIEYVKD